MKSRNSYWWLLLLSLGAHADEVIPVQFRTDPPLVRVYDVDNTYLGTNASSLPLSGRYFQEQAAVSLFLEAPRFKSLEVVVRRQDLSSGSFPPSDRLPLRLEEAHPGVRLGLWVNAHLALVGVVGAAALALAHVVSTAGIRLFRRQQTLRSLESRADRSDSLVLTEVGGYFLTEVLGAGGMATVYRAVPRDRLDDAEAVALKVLNRDSWRDEGFQERFRREVETCRRLDHRNLVRLREWGESQGLTYVVMELVRGRTLSELIPPEGLPVERVVELLTPILEGVDWAHQRGIVHRDLKPDNIMVSDSGLVKVMDFGLARAWDLKTITQLGSVMGTPAYMAPEQAAGLAVDHRGDQYALGVVAYELLSGRRPFVQREPMALLLAHMHDPPPPLASPLAPVVMRMLAKGPDDRFPDLLAVRDALR